MYHSSPLKPTWLKAFLSLLMAFFWGLMIGTLMFRENQWLLKHHLGDHRFAIKIALEYLLFWPVLCMHATGDVIPNLWKTLPVLWLYFYFLVCLADYGERAVRIRYLE